MDEHESGRALIDDALDRELEHALAVDPSPAFVARVRTRISSEPETSWWPSRWIFGLAGAAAVAIIVVTVVVSRPGRSAQDSSAALPERVALTPPTISKPVVEDFPGLSGVEGSPAPLARSARAVARRQVPRTPPRSASMPAVIVAAGEAAALRQFIAAVQLGRFDPAKLPERPAATVALQTPNEITIAPITFEPIVTPMAGQGERQ